tara:strand:+ start:5251 stop:5418 length:168 start_codon:yes stop_codon:yes gene_type:complete
LHPIIGISHQVLHDDDEEVAVVTFVDTQVEIVVAETAEDRLTNSPHMTYRSVAVL